MKKLLVLSLVLGIASLASAGYSIVGYDGQVLQPSDTLTLEIVATGVDAAQYAYGVLVVDPQEGSVEGGVAGVGSLTAMQGGALLDFFPVAPKTGIDFYAGDSTGAVLDGVVVGEITFHCNGPIPAVVDLWVSPDFVNFEMIDSIQIAQAPEPATMALLGLGALVLRRKK